MYDVLQPRIGEEQGLMDGCKENREAGVTE